MTLPFGWRVRAAAACAVLPPLLQLMSFTRVAALAGRGPARPRSDAPLDAALADYVAGRLRTLPPPWRYTCLRRSVVLFHLLRHAGRPVALRIGVRKNARGALQAHAWLLRDGLPYLEGEESEHHAFQVIATFPDAAVT